MYFELIYSRESGQYHARLYGSGHDLLFWTQEDTSKQSVVRACDEVRRRVNCAIPIIEL